MSLRALFTWWKNLWISRPHVIQTRVGQGSTVQLALHICRFHIHRFDQLRNENNIFTSPTADSQLFSIGGWLNPQCEGLTVVLFFSVVIESSVPWVSGGAALHKSWWKTGTYFNGNSGMMPKLLNWQDLFFYSSELLFYCLFFSMDTPLIIFLPDVQGICVVFPWQLSTFLSQFTLIFSLGLFPL